MYLSIELKILKDNKTYPEELVGLRGGSGLKNTFFSASNTYKKNKLEIFLVRKTKLKLTWTDLNSISKDSVGEKKSV